MGVPYTKLASVVSVAAIVGAVVFHSPVSAAPATFTWTGSAGDHKMSTAGNWKEGQVPTEGSKLVFTCVEGSTANGYRIEIQNDLTVALSGLEVKKLDSLPDGKWCARYNIDKMRFTSDAEFTGDHTSIDSKDEHKTPEVYVAGAVTGLSSLKSNGFNGGFKGEPTINRFEVANTGCNNIGNTKASEIIIGENASVSPKNANSITVKNKGHLEISYYGNETSTSKITFENGAMISHGMHCQGGGGAASNVTTVLSGDITLNGDVEYWLSSNTTLKITGKLSGPGKLVAHKDNESTVLVESSNNTSGTPNGQIGYTNETKTIQLDGNKPDESVIVKKGETVLLNGNRSDVSVRKGGVFGGDATVKSLYVDGVVAPGNSPGKITVLNSFSISETGVYKAEILNKDHYDQIVAQDVYIDAQSKLDLTYLAGGVIKKGDTFTIVNNNGTNPVQGTFKDLPEGAEVTVSGATFKISYVGGDGNDVVLTAQNDSKAPKAPNTGGEKLSVNLIGAIAGVASAAALLFVTKRKSLSKK